MPSSSPSYTPVDTASRATTTLWRTLAVLAVVGVLAACSAVQLAYRQAPRLTLWWVNNQVSLDEAQSAWLAADLDALAAWHRQTGLPGALSTLRRWQAMAPQDWTTRQICQEVADVRSEGERVARQALPTLARLSLQLTPAQLQRLSDQHADRVAEFREEYLYNTPEDRIKRRLTRSTDRLESFYGELTPSQRAALRQDLARSPYNPAVALAERERRHRDLLATVRSAQEIAGKRASGDNAATPPAVEALWQDWLQRSLYPPTAAAAAHNAAMLQFSCEQLAVWHNRTNTEQRQALVSSLEDYARDVQSLLGGP